MPHTKQGFKRIRQNISHRTRNRMLRSTLRTSIRRVRDSLSSGADIEATTKLFREMVSIADSSARKGIIHSNLAARIKSRLNRAIRLSGS